MKNMFPSNEFILDRLKYPTGKINMVLDTDAYNEIDDQFALVLALRSPDRFNIEAVYAAPFQNQRSNGPSDGMEKSYEEICRVMDIMGIDHEGSVFKGSKNFMNNIKIPCESEAAYDLIRRAKEATETLYVVAIGAITNIASAISIEPCIIEKIVVVWLGGNAVYWPHNDEFNLRQDILAAQLIFNCGVPLVHIPCLGAASHLTTTLPELEKHIDGKSAIGSYLTKIFRNYSADHFAYAKEIWDIAALAYLIDRDFVQSSIIHSPVINDQMTWSFDSRRHFIRSAYYINRNEVFKDLFIKILDEKG